MHAGMSACFEGNPSSMLVRSSWRSSSDVVASLRRCQVMGSLVSRAEQKVDMRSSSSNAESSTNSPAIRDSGMRGGAETASGRNIPGGVCDPDGYRDKASDVELRTPGM